MALTLDFIDGQLVSSNGTLTVRAGKTRSETAWPDIRRVWVREGRAFRHPLLGAAFGLALLIGSGWLVAGALLAGGGGLVNRAGIAAVFGVGLGAWVLWDVLRSPRVCWLGVETPAGRREWAVGGVDRAALEAWLEQARANAGPSLGGG